VSNSDSDLLNPFLSN